MIGTMLLDTFFDPPLVGMVVRKHSWNISNMHDDWVVEWNTGKTTWMSRESMQLYINDYQKLKKSIEGH